MDLNFKSNIDEYSINLKSQTITTKDDAKLIYKRFYTFIFSGFYLFEGIHQGLPYIYPFLLIKFQNGIYNASEIMFIASLTTLPWALKFLIGLINDRLDSI
ncbi:MAG: hypothetical protein ACTSRZ_13375 [Promethearchaeota archaeon]